MKFRKDFVTNSSSSSFIVSIRIDTKNGNCIRFEANGGTPESGRIDYFDTDAMVHLSPKQLANASSVEEMIHLLTEGVVDRCEWDDDNSGVKIFEKSNPVETEVFGCMFDDDEENDDCTRTKIFDAYDFIVQIREQLKSMDDISSVEIFGEEINYETYSQKYVYDKIHNHYYGRVQGCEFEKDGASGGCITIPDSEECDIQYEDAYDY